MSEYDRTPEMPDLSGIYIIPAGKAGKAAKQRFANERKVRMKKIRRLAGNGTGSGLLVMLTASDQKLCRYIMKKLGRVIPFFVRTHADRSCQSAAREMSRLLCRCEELGMRTLWLDLAGTEKLDKKQVLYIVAGELIRVLEAPVPVIKEEPTAEEFPAEESFDKSEEVSEAEELPIEEIVEEPEEVPAEAAEQEEPAAEELPIEEIVEEPEEVPVEADEPEENREESADPEEASLEEVKPEEPEIAEEPEEVPVEAAEQVAAISEAAEPEEKTEGSDEPEEMHEESAKQESAAEVPSAEKAAPVRRRTRKSSSKAEGDAPTKPRKRRQPRGPLTVEETLARRRRQLGLEE